MTSAGYFQLCARLGVVVTLQGDAQQEQQQQQGQVYAPSAGFYLETREQCHSFQAPPREGFNLPPGPGLSSA